MQTQSQVQRSVHTVSRLSKYSLFIFQCAMHTNYVFVIISFVFFIVPFLPWCFQLHQPKNIYSHNYSIVSLSIQCVRIVQTCTKSFHICRWYAFIQLSLTVKFNVMISNCWKSRIHFILQYIEMKARKNPR